jgi:hypothetical protein
MRILPIKTGIFGTEWIAMEDHGQRKQPEVSANPPPSLPAAVLSSPQLDRTAKGCKMKYSFELGGKSVNADWTAAWN